MMPQQARQQRIQKELKELDKFRLQKKLPSNISYEPHTVDGIINDYNLLITIQGRPNTIWENYKEIQGILVFPRNYPLEAPSFKFLGDFKHVHVYECGSICLPMISQEIWECKTNVFNILVQIEDLIHRDPNIHSPANSNLNTIYQLNRSEYEKIIREKITQIPNLSE